MTLNNLNTAEIGIGFIQYNERFKTNFQHDRDTHVDTPVQFRQAN